MTRVEPAVLNSRLNADVWRAVAQRAYRAGNSTNPAASYGLARHGVRAGASWHP